MRIAPKTSDAWTTSSNARSSTSLLIIEAAVIAFIPISCIQSDGCSIPIVLTVYELGSPIL